VSLPWWVTTVLWARRVRKFGIFGSRELEREASARTSGTKTPQKTRNPENFDDGKTTVEAPVNGPLKPVKVSRDLVCPCST
jgi:hypothetical protein